MQARESPNGLSCISNGPRVVYDDVANAHGKTGKSIASNCATYSTTINKGKEDLFFSWGKSIPLDQHKDHSSAESGRVQIHYCFKQIITMHRAGTPAS